MTPSQESDARCSMTATCGLASCDGQLRDYDGYVLTWRWTAGSGWVPVELWGRGRRLSANDRVYCDRCHRSWRVAEAERKAADAGYASIRRADP